VIPEGDWRLQGQERWLHGVRLRRRPWESFRPDWDHDHCEFCGCKFSRSPDDLGEGYATLDAYHWICETCFHDFHEAFAWVV
jgi:hypothetical protein